MKATLLAIPTTRSGIIVFIKKVEKTSNDATHAAITNHMSHLHLSRQGTWFAEGIAVVMFAACLAVTVPRGAGTGGTSQSVHAISESPRWGGRQAGTNKRPHLHQPDARHRLLGAAEPLTDRDEPQRH